MSRILLVDDDETMVSLLKTLLEMDGFEVVSSSNWQDIPADVRTSDADVLLMDCNLPAVDGLDILVGLRRDEELSNLRIIMTSGMDLEFSAITDTIFDEYFTGYVKDMAEVEELFNVEIVDQEISYDETGEKLELPDVTGMTVENAENLLRSLGFEVEILEGSSEYGAGIIYRQKPEPGVFSDPLITVVKIYNTVDE